MNRVLNVTRVLETFHKRRLHFWQEFAASHPGQDVKAAANPMLMGLLPAQYVLGALEKVRPAEMEQALLLLPFSYALNLLGYLCYWLEKGLKACSHPAESYHLYATRIEPLEVALTIKKT